MWREGTVCPEDAAAQWEGRAVGEASEDWVLSAPLAAGGEGEPVQGLLGRQQATLWACRVNPSRGSAGGPQNDGLEGWGMRH